MILARWVLKHCCVTFDHCGACAGRLGAPLYVWDAVHTSFLLPPVGTDSGRSSRSDAGLPDVLCENDIGNGEPDADDKVDSGVSDHE